jgi:SAM-dependent methyltransferase
MTGDRWRGDIWDERYGQEGWAFGTEPNDFLRASLDRLPSGRFLLLGEGEGRNAIFLAEKGRDVTAVDRSSVGLSKARALAVERGVELLTVHSDLADFEIVPGEWDGIVSIFCHLPPDLRGAVHRAAVRGLRPGGVLLMELYTPRQLLFATGGPSRPEVLVEPGDLRKELEGLRFEVFREIEREIHEGRYHGGTSAVLQVLAFARGERA